MFRRFVDNLIILNTHQYVPILELSKILKQKSGMLLSTLEYLNKRLFKFFTFQFLFLSDYYLLQRKFKFMDNIIYLWQNKSF